MSDTQTIKDRLDIVDLIQEYIPMKQAGTNWKARCPFHDEKTPSFMASREKQIYHCFGCNKGGDVFAFIQEMEGLNFSEALKLLADKAGVQLTKISHDDIRASQKNRLLDILSFAANWFHQGLLKSPRSEQARIYLSKRGLNNSPPFQGGASSSPPFQGGEGGVSKEKNQQSTINNQHLIQKFQIGFVPEEWDLLTKSLLRQGFGIEDCVASGLTIQKAGRGGYDRFRGRIMFPIWNVHGIVVGFTGRLLIEKEDAGGKYVNTPQTLVYDKSRVIYGLNLAKQAIKQQKYAIVVEGQMDVIAGHKAGTENIVASSGTAFAEHQMRLLKRFTNELRMAFDMDEAGISAAIRCVEGALAFGFEVKVIVLPEGAGKDPDECIQKNPEIWKRAIINAEPIVQFLIGHALSQSAGRGIRELKNALIPVIKMIQAIPSVIEQGHWIHELSEKTNIREDDLRAEIRSIKKISPPYQGGARGGSAGDQKEVEKILDTSRRRAEFLLAIAVRYPAVVSSLQTVPEAVFSEDCLNIYKQIVVYYKSHTPSNWKDSYSTIQKMLQEESAQKLSQLYLLSESFEFSERDAVNQAQIFSEALRNRWLKGRRAELIAALKQAEMSGDKNSVSSLLGQLQSLN